MSGVIIEEGWEKSKLIRGDCDFVGLPGLWQNASTMARHWKTLLKAAISLGLILFLLSRIDLASLGRVLVHANPWWVVATILLFAFSILLRTLRWGVLVHARDMDVGFWSLARWYYIGAFFNTLLPTGFGGDVIKSIYLSKATDDAGGAVGTVVLDRLLGILVLLGIGAVAAPFSRADIHPLILIFILLAFLGGIAAFWLLRQRRLIRWLRDRVFRLLPAGLAQRLASMPSLRSLYDALQDYDNRTLARAVGMSLIFNASWILINMTAGQAVGIQAHFVDYLVFVPLVSLALLLPSIGGIGVRELSYVGLFTQIGAAPEQAMAMSLIIYLATVITGLLGGVLMLLEL